MIRRSHSRPHVSNDNCYSEAQFKTLKYCPTFRDRFGCIQDARAFCAVYFRSFNHEHRHSGIAYHMPASVHYGTASDGGELQWFGPAVAEPRGVGSERHIEGRGAPGAYLLDQPARSSARGGAHTEHFMTVCLIRLDSFRDLHRNLSQRASSLFCSPAPVARC